MIETYCICDGSEALMYCALTADHACTLEANRLSARSMTCALQCSYSSSSCAVLAEAALMRTAPSPPTVTLTASSPRDHSSCFELAS
jgi:hypothetical protein